MRPQRKLVQAQVILVFADVDADGEIGETSQPVQLNLSGKEWKERWATAHSRRVFENVLAQLNSTANGAPAEPVESSKKATRTK